MIIHTGKRTIRLWFHCWLHRPLHEPGFAARFILEAIPLDAAAGKLVGDDHIQSVVEFLKDDVTKNLL